MHKDETQDNQDDSNHELNPQCAAGSTQQGISHDANVDNSASTGQKNKSIFTRLRDEPTNVKMSLLLDVVLIIITTVYAVFAALQWNTLRRQAEGIEDQ